MSIKVRRYVSDFEAAQVVLQVILHSISIGDGPIQVIDKVIFVDSNDKREETQEWSVY